MQMKPLRLLFLLAPLLCGPLFAQTQRVVRLSAPDAVNPAEVSIAINPTNPNNIVGVSLQYGKAGQPRVSNVAYVSSDGGHTWETIASHNPDGRIQGDDAVIMNAGGTAFHAYISFDGIRQKRPKVARNGIFVQSSADGGRTWAEPVPVVDHLNTVLPFEDKPYLASDDGHDSPYAGNLYLAWTRFDEYGSELPADSTQIFFARSDDNGRTFSMPFRISDTGGDCRDGDNTVEGAVPAVAPNGDVYVVWAGPKGLVFDRSADGGWTFGKDRIIADMPGGWDLEIPGINRSNGMPVTGVDHSDGPFRGSLYVNWIDTRNGDPDVFVLSSRDGGETWSEPVRVNDDAAGNDQFFTWMAVDPADGSVNILFYDRRGLEDNNTGLVLARSVDGGRTFVNHSVHQKPFRTDASIFFGDYNGIDAHGGKVTAIYTHFLDDRTLAVSSALFQFKPGTQDFSGTR